MNASAASTEVIDLSDPKALTSDEIDERHDELVRIVRKLDALQMRKHVLECELGLESATTVDVDLSDLEAEIAKVAANTSLQFLDDSMDAFDAVPQEERSADFDIDDTDFDVRFAAFASTDAEGDHAARRWLAR